MREIKFREFVNGTFHYWGFVSEGSFYGPATPSIIRGKHQQFTGLKDKNGKEIYEGDILKLSSAKVETLCEVIWYVDGWQLRWITPDDILINFNGKLSSKINLKKLNRSELIGNIYEHPELIIK